MRAVRSGKEGTRRRRERGEMRRSMRRRRRGVQGTWFSSKRRQGRCFKKWPLTSNSTNLSSTSQRRCNSIETPLPVSRIRYTQGRYSKICITNPSRLGHPLIICMNMTIIGSKKVLKKDKKRLKIKLILKRSKKNQRQQMKRPNKIQRNLKLYNNHKIPCH